MKSSKQENTGSNKYIIKTKNMDIEAIFTCLPSTASTTISATLPSDLQLETIFICGSTSITDLFPSLLQILFHIHILTHYVLCGINSKTYLPPHSLPYWREESAKPFGLNFAIYITHLSNDFLYFRPKPTLFWGSCWAEEFLRKHRWPTPQLVQWLMRECAWRKMKQSEWDVGYGFTKKRSPFLKNKNIP